MSDEPQDRGKTPPGEQLDDLQRDAEGGTLSTKEQFEKTSKIGLLMAYDLIDKLRFWEKHTLNRPDDEVEARLEHLVESVEKLRAAYLAFAEMDD